MWDSVSNSTMRSKDDVRFQWKFLNWLFAWNYLFNKRSEMEGEFRNWIMSKFCGNILELDGFSERQMRRHLKEDSWKPIRIHKRIIKSEQTWKLFYDISSDRKMFAEKNRFSYNVKVIWYNIVLRRGVTF